MEKLKNSMDIEDEGRVISIQNLVNEMNLKLGKIHDIVPYSLIFISKM
jgi:hypothetical protein